MLNVTVLCSVIDNYGDIGFVYRLCRRLGEISNDIKLRIVCDNLNSFAFMNSGIKPGLSEQEFNSWKIFDWNDAEVCTKEFTEREPQFILQCFQCKLPEWLESILYDGKLKGSAYIINVEYLTAEEWADGFHKLRSGTRSVQVKKSFFMPGFTKKTGGLVLDGNFKKCIGYKKHALEKASERLNQVQKEILHSDDYFKILVFSYPRNFNFLVEAINSFGDFSEKKVHVFLAKGISSAPFVKSCQEVGDTFEYSELPALEQEQWDALICSMDFNFIRGEDSFSRASLSGIPFVWHVYVQDEEFQLVKLNAFLERMKPFFSADVFEDYKRFCFLYNRTFPVEPGDEACQAIATLKEPLPLNEGSAEEEMSSLAAKLLFAAEKEKKSFEKASADFLGNGDLAENLLEFLNSLEF
ncbi:elongation factor P maturation arginine rhamnosyltransferase EarP [Treponema sp.]|uniref:elongation factor P maturation arginine rhamnosyltransferase EarP n=1 Tax=Treponema sp. TaxID=166 RepID=UPI00298E8516|nr:elongation factor P maturation arginine rhamnosyltransferase EarP [Treponema sp.]MCQ2240351.1 elongation factor P maturation arginine rhamnosyltransferase EarP [Treponema sp.]